MMQTNIIRKLEIHAEDHEDQAPIFRKYIKEHDEKRVQAVWDAIAVAQEEKRQGWRYAEDGANFLAYCCVWCDLVFFWIRNSHSLTTFLLLISFCTFGHIALLVEFEAFLPLSLALDRRCT